MLKTKLLKQYEFCDEGANGITKIANFEQFYQQIIPLLRVHEIEFKYQKHGCKRAGAAKLIRSNQLMKYTILIDPQLGEFAKINVFIHELMHILLDHLLPKAENKFYLTGPQKEFVVDYLAEYHTKQLTGLCLSKYAHEYKRHRIESYRVDWIKNARINSKQIATIELQINYGKELLERYFKEQENNHC